VCGIAPDDFPSDKVTIAAALWINQKSADCVVPNRLEKSGCSRGLIASARACLGKLCRGQLSQDFVLLLRSSGRKRIYAGKHLRGGTMHVHQARLILRQRIAGEGLQRTVDEVDHARFRGAGKLVRRNDASGNGCNFLGLFRCEYFKRLLGGRRLVRVLSRGNHRGPLCTDPGCSCYSAQLQKKISSV